MRSLHTRRVRRNDVESRTHRPPQFDRHARLETFCTRFRGHFTNQGTRCVNRGDDYRSVPKSRIVSARQGDFEERNVQTGNLSFHHRNICSNQWLQTFDSKSILEKPYLHQPLRLC